ncbi:MAG: hypothetical protein O3C34_10375 [Proteobacteria bacterium]|nr:hypothetical protein [Pseudomonadota bacterium]
MPVTYFSSTGAISFAPVAPRDQAVGPMEVVFSVSPPDEIIEPPRGGHPGMSRRSRTIVATAALTAVAGLIMAGAIS